MVVALIAKRFWKEIGLVLLALALLASGRYSLSLRDRITELRTQANERIAYEQAVADQWRERLKAVVADNAVLRQETERLRLTMGRSIVRFRTVTDTLQLPPEVIALRDTVFVECELCLRQAESKDARIAELERLLREKPLTVVRVEKSSCALPFTLGAVLGGGGGFIAGFNMRGRP